MRVCRFSNRWPLWLVCCAALFCLSVVSFAPAAMASSSKAEAPRAEAQLEEILAAFRQMPGLEARFEEEKQLALLAAPMRSSGRMFFAPGGYLLRRIDSPRQAAVVVTPKELRVEEGSKVQRFDLRARADVAHFVQSFLWILSGDATALRAHFQLNFVPNADDSSWVLTLVPKDDRMAFIVKAIQVHGERFEVREVRVEESNGDSTITRILDANPVRTFSSEERQRLFESSAP